MSKRAELSTLLELRGASPYNKQAKITLNAKLYRAIDNEAKRLGISQVDFVQLMYDFYCLREIELLFSKIKSWHKLGYTPIQINFLCVLFSYLQYLDDVIGLT